MKPALLVALLLPALTACESLPFRKPAVPIPATWQAPAETASSLADQDWHSVLPIPELTALIDEALAANSDLRIAAERVELARAQSGIDRAARWPSLNLATSATRQRMPGAEPAQNTRSESAAFSLAAPAWEIDLWGKLRDRAQAAQHDLRASQAQVQAVRISLAAQVATLYLDLLDLDHQIAIATRTLAARQHALRLNRLRHEEGISSIIDVHQAASLLAAAEQTLADQRRRRALAENSLSTLLGRNPGPLPRSQRLDSLPLLTATSTTAPAGLPATLLQRRPDIRAAEEALLSAHANLAAARKAYLPSLSLTTMLGFASPALRQLFDSGRYAWSVQPAVGLPIFDGGRIGFGVDIAAAQQRILVEQYRAAIRQAFREVDDALAALEHFGTQRSANETSVSANRARLDAANERYLAGIASYFEVLDAERQLLDSEIALSQTTRAVHQSRVQLYRALGGGWSSACKSSPPTLPGC